VKLEASNPIRRIAELQALFPFPRMACCML
jgi:hypothetical protein